MLKNLVQHGNIGETMKYGLLVLFMALISACGGGGGGGAISVATPDNGGESGSPTTIESRISSQLSAMEREIDKLPADERADYKSIIEGLRSDLAAKEMSIEVLTKQLSEIQQQLQELISALPPEESCENYQYYVDGSCKNCPLGMAFDFDRSECVATASSCGAIGQVYADGRCQECRLGTAFSDNECIATEDFCENEQHYIDGSCKNCPPGLAFDFNRSECVATASSCGAIEQVLEGDGCRACESGLKYSDNECIATEDFCENEQHYIDGSCKNCPPGMAFDFNRSECVATASSCGAIEQVLEGDGCRACAAGLEFSNNKCIATESSCENGQVDTDGNCKNCESGMEWKNNECVPTASYCHANNQIFIRGNCQDCESGLEFRNNKCIPTASYCHAQEQVLEDERCRACTSGLEFRNNKCIPTASYCHAHGQVLEDERCRACAAGMEFRNNECVPTALITIAVSCDGHLYNPIAGYIYSAYDGPIYTAHDWRSIGGRFYKDDHVYAPGDWSDCTPTASLCEDDEIRFIDGACITCPAGMTPNVDNSQCVATASSCGTVERISVDGRCQDCPAGTAFRNNECVPVALSCAEGQIYSVGSDSCIDCAPGMEANIENNGCIATVSSCGAIGQVYADGNCRECESGVAFRNNECVPVALSCADGHVYAEEIDGCVDCPAGMVANSENTACIATVSPLYNELVAAIKREIAKLPENKRAVYESRLTGLTIGLSQQEVSTSDLSFLLADIQQHILSIIVVCGASGHVYADGRCQECPSGTNLINKYGPDTACIPVALSCVDGHVYADEIDGCVDCPAGMVANSENTACIATALSCGAIGQVYVDGKCKACESGMEFSDNKCVPTAASCHAKEQVLTRNRCQDCEWGLEFSDNKCIPTASYCHTQERVLEDNRCQECQSGMVFRDNECIIATASSCGTIRQVYIDGNCQECQSGMKFSNNKCIPTALSCTDGQIYSAEADRCMQVKDCPAGEESFYNFACRATGAACLANGQSYSSYNRNCYDCPDGKEPAGSPYWECRATASSCGTLGQTFDYRNNICRDCPSGTAFGDNKCIPTASFCHARGMEFSDNKCIPMHNCPSGMELSFDGSQCIATVSSCGKIGQDYADGSCRDCRAGWSFAGDRCTPRSWTTAEECHRFGKQFIDENGGFCRQCPPTAPVLNGNVCTATTKACQSNDKVLVGDMCVSTVATCNANDKILVGDSCESCPEDMRFRDNQCVVRSEFDTAEYRANPAYEDMKLSYAYERGYFGQGVTVALIHQAGYAIDHPDLAANYITASIAGTRDFRLTVRGGGGDEARFAGLIGATRNGIGMHGIAPEVKMVPLPAGYAPLSVAYETVDGYARYEINGHILRRHDPLPYGDGINEQYPFATYLRESNIPIINNGTKDIRYRVDVPRLETGWNQDISSYGIRNMTDSARFYNDFVGDSDAVWVFPAGYLGSAAARFYPRLQTLWVSASAPWMSAYEVISSRHGRSNGNHNIHRSAYCRNVKDWCVTAPVYKGSATSKYYEIKNLYSRVTPTFRGPAYAAAQVSGALAILYGALGIESPQMARAILLTTATDLGEPGVDEIYGHGLVNISAGIALIENMKTAAAEGLSAVSFDNLRGELPSGFSHLHDELSAVQVAVKLTNGLYYNVPLSEMMTPGDDAPDVPLGGGATDMLADAESESRRGFFAYGDIDAEMGLRYYGGEGGFSYVAEGQHATTNQRYFNGNFGSLGGVSGKVYSGKVGFTRDMNMAGMQIFGDYERAAVGGDGDEGNLIVGVRDARAESWMAGMSFSDIWKYGDKIRLSARQEMGLSGGDLIVRYPHAVGDFHETFIGEGAQEIEVREAFLPLKQRVLMLYTAGYAQKINSTSEWALALEYNAGNNAKAISLIWQGEF